MSADGYYNIIWRALESEPSIYWGTWAYFFGITIMLTFLMLGLFVAVVTGTFRSIQKAQGNVFVVPEQMVFDESGEKEAAEIKAIEDEKKAAASDRHGRPRTQGTSPVRPATEQGEHVPTDGQASSGAQQRDGTTTAKNNNAFEGSVESKSESFAMAGNSSMNSFKPGSNGDAANIDKTLASINLRTKRKKNPVKWLLKDIGQGLRRSVIRSNSRIHAIRARTQEDDGDSIRPFCEKLAASRRLKYSTSLAICVYLVALSANQHDAPPSWAQYVTYALTVCTGIFWLEFGIRFNASGGLGGYLQTSANRLELLINILCTVGIATDFKGLVLLGAFRMYRLMIFVPTLNAIMMCCFASVKAVLNLIFLIALIAVVFTVVGRFLFANELADYRPNYSSFEDGLIAIFQTFTGDSWSTVLYDSMASKRTTLMHFLAAGFTCAWYFISRVVIFNLFVAVILEVGPLSGLGCEPSSAFCVLLCAFWVVDFHERVGRTSACMFMCIHTYIYIYIYIYAHTHIYMYLHTRIRIYNTYICLHTHTNTQPNTRAQNFQYELHSIKHQAGWHTLTYIYTQIHTHAELPNERDCIKHQASWVRARQPQHDTKGVCQSCVQTASRSAWKRPIQGCSR
jgi:hypothetical protein